MPQEVTALTNLCTKSASWILPRANADGTTTMLEQYRKRFNYHCNSISSWFLFVEQLKKIGKRARFQLHKQKMTYNMREWRPINGLFSQIPSCITHNCSVCCWSNNTLIGFLTTRIPSVHSWRILTPPCKLSGGYRFHIVC